MLADISWGAYLTTIILLLVIWYGCLVFRFYRGRLNDFLRHGFRQNRSNDWDGEGDGPFSEFNEPFDTLRDAEELYDKIIKVFTESDAGSVSRIEFLNCLRFVMEEYPFVKQSALRAKINSLMELESRKYPHLQLTSKEADGLWESGQ